MKLQKSCADEGAVAESLDALMARYEGCVSVERKQLGEAVTNALETTREFARIISSELEATPFFGKV